MAYNPGVQQGSAFLNSFMASYNKAMYMQADINKFKYQTKRQDELLGMQRQSHAATMERDERSEFMQYAKLKRQDDVLSEFDDTAGGPSLSSEYKSKFITGIGKPPQADIGQPATSGIGASGDYDIEQIGSSEPTRIKAIGRTPRYKTTMFGEVPAYLDTTNNTYWEKLGPGKRGKQLMAKAEFKPTEEKTIPGVEASAARSLEVKTEELEAIPKEAIENPEKRNTIVLDMITSTADQIGETFNGTKEGWDKLGPQTQGIVADKTVDAIFDAKEITWLGKVFNMEGRTPEEKAKLAYSLANVTGADITEKVTERFIEATVEPSLLSKISAWLRPGYKPNFSLGRVQEAIEEVSGVVEKSLMSAGPEVVQGFLGDTKDANGMPIDINSPEAKALIKANVRQAVDKHIKYREKESGGILSTTGSILFGRNPNAAKRPEGLQYIGH